MAALCWMMGVGDQTPTTHSGRPPLVGRDAPAGRDLDVNTAFACAAATSKPTGVSFTSAATVDPVVDLFDLALGSAGPFSRRPFCMAVAIHVVPPLRFSAEGCDIIEAAIERGMVVQTCSAGQAGATSPASLAGSLAQGLAAVVLIDVIKPGHPAIHAFMPFVSDLRTGAMTGGGGEAAVASAGAAQLLNSLGLPHAVSAGITDAKLADTQAGYEKGYTVALAANAGTDMVQLSVGMLGSIMVASPEALVIDDEMCGAILRAVRGIDVTAEAVDLAMVESVVTGDGHYLGHPQTLELMRTEYVYPTIGDRASVADWEAAGRPVTSHRQAPASGPAPGCVSATSAATTRLPTPASPSTSSAHPVRRPATASPSTTPSTSGPAARRLPQADEADSLRARRWLDRASHPVGQVVLDVGADDVFVAVVGHETEGGGPGGVEARGPTSDDVGHRRVGAVADQGHRLGAGHPPEGLDLLADRDRHPRHGEVAAAGQPRRVQLGGMDHEPDRGAGAGVGMANIAPDRQPGLGTVEGLADDAREEA
ncbi:MAG: trimethylamine methyltransferase family protein, partial [Acidimicrobiaceae bacterium]|nr:trimethylamine methyltransferase family protein [Acidimicrobiaceae bacterium]